MNKSLDTGYQIVESEVNCVVTRFRVRTVFGLLRFYVYFRRVRRQAAGISGLITSVFVVENLHTCYTMSFFGDSQAILEFNGTVTSHIHAANASFQDLKRTKHGVHLWSAQFRLSAISPFNFLWKGVKFDEFLRARNHKLDDDAKQAGVV